MTGPALPGSYSRAGIFARAGTRHGLALAAIWLVGSALLIALFRDAIAARLFLHEDVDRRRWLAVLFIAAGVYLLTRQT